MTRNRFPELDWVKQKRDQHNSPHQLTDFAVARNRRNFTNRVARGFVMGTVIVVVFAVEWVVLATTYAYLSIEGTMCG